MVPRQNKRAADMVQLDGSDSAQQPQYQQQLVSVPEPWAARLNRHQIYYEPVAPAASSSSSILPAMSISSKHLQGNVPSSWSYSAPVTTAATLMRSKHQDILIPAASTPSSLRNMDIPNVSPKSTTTLRSVRVSQEIQSTTSATWLYPKDPLFMPMSRETFFLQQQQQQQALMNNRSMMTDTIKSAETTTRDFTIDEVGREDVFIDLLSSMTNVQEMTSSPEEGVDTQQTTRSNVRSSTFAGMKSSSLHPQSSKRLFDPSYSNTESSVLSMIVTHQQHTQQPSIPLLSSIPSSLPPSGHSSTFQPRPSFYPALTWPSSSTHLLSTSKEITVLSAQDRPATAQPHRQPLQAIPLSALNPNQHSVRTAPHNPYKKQRQDTLSQRDQTTLPWKSTKRSISRTSRQPLPPPRDQQKQEKQPQQRRAVSHLPKMDIHEEVHYRGSHLYTTNSPLTSATTAVATTNSLNKSSRSTALAQRTGSNSDDQSKDLTKDQSEDNRDGRDNEENDEPTSGNHSNNPINTDVDSPSPMTSHEKSLKVSHVPSHPLREQTRTSDKGTVDQKAMVQSRIKSGRQQEGHTDSDSPSEVDVNSKRPSVRQSHRHHTVQVTALSNSGGSHLQPILSFSSPGSGKRPRTTQKHPIPAPPIIPSVNVFRKNLKRKHDVFASLDDAVLPVKATRQNKSNGLAFVPQPGLSGDDDLALSVPAHRSPIAASGPQTLSDPFHPRRRSERIEGLPGNGRIPITYLLYAPLNPYTQQIDNTDAAAKTHHHNLRPRLGRSSMTNQSNKDSVHKKLVKFMDDKKNSGHPGDGNDSDDSDDLDDDHSPLTKTQRSRAPSPITTVTTSPKATTGLTVVGRRLRKLAAGAKNDKSSTLLVSQTSNQDEKSTSGLYQELIAFHQHNLRTRSGRSMTMALMSDIKKESTIAGNELGVDRNALANTAHEQEETWIKTKETAVMEDPSSEGCRGRDILHPVRNKKSAAADADDDEDGQLELMPEILEGVDLLPQYPRFFAVHKASATAPDSPTSPPSSLSLSSRSQAQAVFNEPRSDQDLYTPRWTKGRGPEKIGLCPICMPEIELWQKMKCSAYWYHMHYHHGVCASTGVMLPAPEKIEFQDADFLKSQQHQQRNPNRARPHVLALSSSSALPLSKAPTSTNNSLANVDNGDHQSVMTKAKVIEMLSVSGSTEYQELVAAAASELGWIPAAYCDICLRWIPLEGLNRDSGAIPEILWWKHAQQCQKILLRAVARS